VLPRLRVLTDPKQIGRGSATVVSWTLSMRFGSDTVREQP
jgi:hypothetical protein